MITVTYSGALAPQPTMREKVRRLEDELHKLAPAECPVRNLFSQGVMMREMTIPAGVVLTGAEHKTRHFNIISKGRIVVLTDEGMKELAAPCTFESMPGTKRAGYALEETVWTTVHANPDDETDMEALCERYTTSKYSDLMENRNVIEHKEAPCLGVS